MGRVKRMRDAKPGELIAQWGTMPYGETSRDGELCYAWGAGCRSADISLLHFTFASPTYLPGRFDPEPSFLKDLERRGYDLTTFRFSIRKKQTE